MSSFKDLFTDYYGSLMIKPFVCSVLKKFDYTRPPPPAQSNNIVINVIVRVRKRKLIIGFYLQPNYPPIHVNQSTCIN